jgi:hypothetical protein
MLNVNKLIANSLPEVLPDTKTLMRIKDNLNYYVHRARAIKDIASSKRIKQKLSQIDFTDAVKLAMSSKADEEGD